MCQWGAASADLFGLAASGSVAVVTALDTFGAAAVCAARPVVVAIAVTEFVAIQLLGTGKRARSEPTES